MRLRFRAERDAYERFSRRAEGVAEGPGGERFGRLPGGGRLGVYPDGLVYAEARAVTFLEGAESTRLLAADELPLAAQAARAQAERECGELPEHATVGRADLASELRFPDGGEGLSLLHALASVDVPWGKVGVEGLKGGRVETVNVRHVTGRSVHARAYCKATETGTGEPGTWVRLERQMRFRKSREHDVSGFLARDLRADFLGRLRAFANVGDVVVTDVVGALETLAELDIPASQRNRLAGFLLYGARRDEYPARTYYRLTGELRRLGIGLDPAARAGRVVVPIGDYLTRLAEPWAKAA